MNNLLRLTSLIFVVGFFSSCSQVLQNVDLVIDTKKPGNQENFNVISNTLTLEEANSQSAVPYLRKIILNGRDSNSQIVPEETALESNFPKQANPSKYKVGKGDTLEFSKLIDNKNSTSNFKTEWPTLAKKLKYRLGVGDEIALLQIVEVNSQPQNNPEDPQINFSQEEKVQKVIESKGRIGSDGSALLLEVGKLDAIDKTLNELRSEVRNILIRNGASPRFQLEIVNFRSQRAYLTINSISEVIELTDQPTNLREILSHSGQGLKPGAVTRVRLQRDGQTYNMRLRDIFGPNAPKILILSNDHIFVEDMVSIKTTTVSEVGENGFSVIEGVGKIKAAGLTLMEIHEQIDSMTEKLPESTNAFQLNIAKYASQKAFINIKGKAGEIIQISNRKIALEEVLAQRGLSVGGDFITSIKLKRGNNVFKFTLDSLIKKQEDRIFLEPDDRVRVEILPYTENKVFILGGVTPQIFKINPSKRETLADLLFTSGGPLKSSSAKRSEIYLLRGKDPVLAYHLDAQSPTRLIVADNMELRPNDIVYVAEQPIISFNRTLATIFPLRLLLRDIQDENIP